MVVLPSDHAIGNPDRYRTVIAAAARAAEKENALVTIGIQAHQPAHRIRLHGRRRIHWAGCRR